MSTLLQKIKQRRLALGLKQQDMPLRLGMSRQQYQRLEKRGNPRLDLLELVAKGLNSELMLIPQEKASLVKFVLENDIDLKNPPPGLKPSITTMQPLSDDPWQGLLDGDADE